MNKYKDFQKSGSQDAALREIERGELVAARMHKPGYRHKMRRTNNKHNKKTNYTSHWACSRAGLFTLAYCCVCEQKHAERRAL